MKVIDDKGKLFGKINILDLLTIIVLLAVVIGLFSQFSGKEITNIGPSASDQKELEFVVRLNPNYDTFFSQLAVGDKIAEDKRYLEGEIVDVKISDYYVARDNYEGQIIHSKHPFYKQAEVTIRAKVNVNGPIVKFGKQEIRAGSSYFVTTNLCKLSGFINEILE